MSKLFNNILKSSMFADKLRIFCVRTLSDLSCELHRKRVRMSEVLQVEAVDTDTLSILFNNSVSLLNFSKVK